MTQNPGRAMRRRLVDRPKPGPGGTANTCATPPSRRWMISASASAGVSNSASVGAARARSTTTVHSPHEPLSARHVD
jgi:hypothetical protein